MVDSELQLMACVPENPRCDDIITLFDSVAEPWYEDVGGGRVIAWLLS
jgi:hypothetical protein